MKVILLKSVPKVGKKDDVVEVAKGYAEHSLFPKKLAIQANENTIKLLKNKKEKEAENVSTRVLQLDSLIKKVKEKNFIIAVKSNDSGNLFSKITSSDIANFIKEKFGFEIDPKIIHIQDGTIKSLGIYTILIVEKEYKSDFVIEFCRKED